MDAISTQCAIEFLEREIAPVRADRPVDPYDVRVRIISDAIRHLRRSLFDYLTGND